jgi:hypothetical protein
MTKKTTPLETWRSAIADALWANTSATSLPTVCVGLGLANGDVDEALASKRKYVRTRIQLYKGPELIKLAEAVLEEFDAPGLQDLLSEVNFHSTHRISDFTRREVLKKLIPLDPLFGELGLNQLNNNLNVIAPPWDQPSEFGGVYRGVPKTFTDDVDKHYVNETDWDNFQLLEKCGALTCTQDRFFALLQRLLDPIIRKGKEQQSLAEELSTVLRPDGFGVVVTEQVSGQSVYGVQRLGNGVAGAVKNLIFASVGKKPELILRDAVSNDVEIIKHGDKCLIYDQPLPSTGLPWVTIAKWWMEREGFDDLKVARKGLGERLLRSVELTRSPGEYAIFRTYYEVFGPRLGEKLPALIPQVYLHYDPMTAAQRGNAKILERQRMDFLLLLDNHVRVVVEVDGRQHYAEGDQASPRLYAAMAAEDRRLRLKGYELYRFGGAEFSDCQIESDHRYTIGPISHDVVTEFFERLFLNHNLKL